jgi:hypothetical protein
VSRIMAVFVGGLPAFVAGWCWILVGLASAAADPALQETSVPPSLRALERAAREPRLEDVLARLARLDVAPAQELAARSGLDLQDHRVLVEVSAEAGRSLDDVDVGFMTAQGAVIQKRSRNTLRLWVPLDRLRELAEGTAGLGVIRRPRLAHTAVIQSEAVALTGAGGWQGFGADGSGVKAAVIDAGFVGLAAAKAAGEVPLSAVERDESGAGMESDTQHGTAVTEVMYDMAPGAQLYLVHIRSNADLADAVDYCIGQGVQVINMSLAWFNFNHEDGVSYSPWTQGYLGISPITSMNEATGGGILPVVAAGNYAQGHYSGFFNDNGSGLHDFGGGDIGLTIYAIAGQTIIGALNWDAWPLTDQDFDLYLYRTSGNRRVASSSGDQETGLWPIPEEYISYTVPGGQTGYYFFVFSKWSATYTPHFEFFCPTHTILDWPVAAGSISTPADASACLAVGAMSRLNWTTGPQESFSSQGPTNQPLIKPDIIGADNCNSFTWGHWLGTSQASPHVAAAAVLVASRFGGFGPMEIRNYLQSSTIGMGAPGQDNVYGFGRLTLWGFGDLNHDCDRDTSDFGVLAGALSGPGQPAGTIEADLDGDGDCDLQDVAVFMSTLTGPGGGCP